MLLVYVGVMVLCFYVEVILVKDDSLQKLVQLKGKCIVLNKGFNVYYFLVKLLEKYGLQYGDVILVWLVLVDVCVVFECGLVDVWVIWEFYLVVVQQILKVCILVDVDGVVKNCVYYFLICDYVWDNVDFICIVLEELVKVDEFVKMCFDDYVSELVGILGLFKGVLDVVVCCYNYGMLLIMYVIFDE